MNTISQIPHNGTPRQAAEQAITDLQQNGGVRFAGPTQSTLATLFLQALAGEWANHVPLIGEPGIGPQHLIDNLARNYVLIPEDLTFLGDPLDVCAVVDKLPTCDGCKDPAARYDTWATRTRPAMFLCETCATPEAGRPLGLGTATYLLTFGEVPWTIRDICNQVATELGRPSIWPR